MLRVLLRDTLVLLHFQGRAVFEIYVQKKYKHKENGASIAAYYFVGNNVTALPSNTQDRRVKGDSVVINQYCSGPGADAAIVCNAARFPWADRLWQMKSTFAANLLSQGYHDSGICCLMLRVKDA